MTVTEEREFQLQILKAQSFISNMNSYFTALTAVSLSLFGVLLALTSSIMNSVLGGPTILKGNFSDGVATWTGELSGATNVNSAYYLSLVYSEYIFLIIGIVGFVMILYFNLSLAPKKIDHIRQRFISSKVNNTLPNPSTPVTRIAKSSKKSNSPRPEDLLAQYKETQKNQRFLLRLLWEIPSIAIAISSAFLVAAYNFFPNGSNDPLIRCVLLAFGSLLMFVSFLAVVKHRYYRGIWLESINDTENSMHLNPTPLYIKNHEETESYKSTGAFHKFFIAKSVETWLANVILITAMIFAILAFINLCQFSGLFELLGTAKILPTS